MGDEGAQVLYNFLLRPGQLKCVNIDLCDFLTMRGFHIHKWFLTPDFPIAGGRMKILIPFEFSSINLPQRVTGPLLIFEH